MNSIEFEKHLPYLNERTFRNFMSLEEFLVAIMPFAHDIIEAAQHCDTERDARARLLELAMVVLSAERHGQAAGQPKGSALSRLNGAEDTLVRLGAKGDHPPTMSADLFWLFNTRYSFTTNPEERLFADVVRDTVACFETISSNLAIAAERWGTVSVRERTEALDRAAAAAETACKLLSKLASFSGPFFTFEFRTFLVGLPIKGKDWDGPSAANFAPVMVSDVTLTAATKFYFKYIQGRMGTLPGEGRTRVSEALFGETVDAAIHRIVFSGSSSSTEEPAIDSAILATGSIELLLALDRYVEALGRWSKIHLALVRKKLEEPAAAGLAANKTPDAVSADRGTGGGDWREELKRIMNERINPGGLRPLIESARRLRGLHQRRHSVEVRHEQRT
jgi:hypothetical protein